MFIIRTWENLQSDLEKLFGSRHVYYNPPDNLTMEYPAIRYSLSDIDSKYANNSQYIGFKSYDIVVISEESDNPVIEKLLRLPHSSFERHYVSNNLNHDIIKLYY